MTSSTRASALLLLGAAVLAPACGGDSDKTATTTGSGGSGGGGGGCAAGSLEGDDSACHAVGVQSCAAVFVDADGLCRPSMDKCKKGTIPKFDTGCIAVGIPACAKEFVGADGFCHVRSSLCPAGKMAVPEKGCVPLGGAFECGSGTWGNIPGGANVVYVDASFEGTSTGSKAAPFTTIGDAIAAAPVGGQVALAAGEYTESVSIDRDVDIRGRCASMVKIIGPGADFQPNTIEIDRGSATIEGLTISGDGVGVFVASTAVLDGVVIDGASHFGVTVLGGDVTIKNTSIKNTRSLDSLGGLAVYATGASTITISDSAFFGNHDGGLDALDPGAIFTLDDVLIENSLPTEGTLVNGDGLVVQAGVTANLRGVAIVASHLDGLEAFGEGASLTATNVVVENTLPQASDGYLGSGIQLYQGASMKISGSAFFANSEVGFLVDAAKLDVDTTLVFGTLPAKDGTFGRGLEAQDAAQVKLVDSAFVENHDIALLTLETGTKLELDHVLIEDTRSNADATFGVGIFADSGTTLVADSAVVARSHVAGAVIAGGTATIKASLFAQTLAGTIILQHPAKTITDVGDGVLVMLGGPGAAVSGTRVEHSARAGALFDGGTGAITASSLTDNRYGLVLEGGTTASADQATNLAGNSDRAKVVDGSLPVPSRPAAVPR